MTKTLLFVEGNTDGTVGGSYFVMLDLVSGLNRREFKPIVVFHQENYLCGELRTRGIETHVLPKPEPFIIRSATANRYLGPLRRFVNFFITFLIPAICHAAFLRRQQIDLVDLNNSITRNHAWMLAAILARKKCVTHEMGINSTYSRTSRFLGRRLDAVIAVSYAVADSLRSSGIDWENIQIIQNSLDLSRYKRCKSPAELRREHGIPPTAPVVGVVGNIKHWKGQETLVRAAQLLSNDFPELRYLFVGGVSSDDHDYFKYLNGLVATLGLEGTVIFTGFKSNAIDYMELMDVVIHSSINPEPFGIVILEAMSLSKPLISTVIGGPAEIVVDGTTGLLIDPGNPEALANSVKRLLDHPDFAMELGTAGRKRLDEVFSLDANIRKHTALFRKILAVA